MFHYLGLFLSLIVYSQDSVFHYLGLFLRLIVYSQDSVFHYLGLFLSLIFKLYHYLCILRTQCFITLGYF